MRLKKPLVLTTLSLALFATAYPVQSPAPAKSPTSSRTPSQASPRKRTFTQADLEKIVAELDAVIPHNPGYKYPIKVSLVDKPEVNAKAGFETVGKDKQAIMVVYTGLAEFADQDVRLIRACVAHELSHLSQGHSLEASPAARDLDNLWTRQQEYDADKFGAAALLKAGYPKKDMIDLLLLLDRHSGREGGWLYRLTADHADAKARAADLSDNPKALQSLVLFDTALAYEDARDHVYARKLFEAAVAGWPELTMAYTNAAKCSLKLYYDNVPTALRTDWWRPDFGPLMTNVPAPGAGQATEITDQDREAWKAALALAQKAVDMNPRSRDAEEVRALTQVLEPDAKKDVVAKGIEWFKAQATIASDPSDRLRFANNAGVGFQRTSDLDAAYASIIDAQRGNDRFNAALGENLGLVRVKGRTNADDLLAANVLFTWLEATPDSSPNWKLVKSTFDAICTTAHLTPQPIAEKPAYLAQAMTLCTHGKRLGLLLPVSGLIGVMGQPDASAKFDARFPDLQEMRWNTGLVIFTERGKVMRLTTSEPGAYLVLRPKDATLEDKFSVKVGMSKADLFAMLNEKAGVQTLLANRGEVKAWIYFPAVGMGVLIEGDKVAAITVTPVS